MLRLFTDSDCDVTPEIAAEYGYTIISMPYTVEGSTIYPYEDFKEFDGKKFYGMLRSGVIPTTCAISPEKYTGYFEPVFAAGDDILYVHFSSAMTATFGFMDTALAALKNKYPERKFYSLDTKAITIGSLEIVIEAGQMYKNGRTAEEIMKWAETEVDKFATYFYADDLKFFRRSGRVSGLAASMGTLLGVRPIIFMDSDGKMKSVGKERGRANALNRLVDTVSELGDDVAGHKVLIGHTDSPDAARELADALQTRFGEKLDIAFSEVNPTAGSHCGPSGVGVAFHAAHR